MKLGFSEQAPPYRSASQLARHWTEAWVREQVYYTNCGQFNIIKYENNRPAADFHCNACNEEYELKSQKRKFGRKIVDGAYRTLCERLASSDNPNFMLLNYDLGAHAVTNLFVVPKHFFVSDIVERRKPLAPTARRAGWVGCNILLEKIPESGKIFLIQNGLPIPKDLVLSRWQQTLFLRDKNSEARGWLIEVMKCVELLNKPSFDLDDLYGFETRLIGIYPRNRHIKEKIRQQLQVLRDQAIWNSWHAASTGLLITERYYYPQVQTMSGTGDPICQ